MNCGAQVAGRFCQVCGQENVDTKETFWHLVTHFFNDVTHYDNKFFSTIKLLLLKPGLLTAEYTRGRRAAYLHPIRMYVFTSAFFFLLYFTFFNTPSTSKREETNATVERLATAEAEYDRLLEMKLLTRNSATKQAIDQALLKYESKIALLNDSIKKSGRSRQSRTGNASKLQPAAPADTLTAPADDATAENPVKEPEEADTSFLNFEFYQDEATYRAIQDELPEGKRDGTMERLMKEELLRFHEKQKTDSNKTIANIREKFKHSFPTLLFVSLPFFAWSLKLLYIRRRKFLYADHGILAIHSYCGIFLLLLIYYFLDALLVKLDWWIFWLLRTITAVYIIYFVYKSMRNFYGQGRAKTLLKYVLLFFMTAIVMGVLALTFLTISALRA